MDSFRLFESKHTSWRALGLCVLTAVLCSVTWAQPSQRRPPAPLGVEQRAELRRDVVDEQSRKSEDLARAPRQRHLSPEQRAELRRQLREQAREQPGRAGNAP